jgi:hypothetical protein
MELIDISKDMNDAFYANKDIKVGSVLMFKSKDEKTGEVEDTNLKIIRLNRKSKICLVEEIKLYTSDEAEVEWEERIEKDKKRKGSDAKA